MAEFNILYQKGFNGGYLIAKYLPKLSRTLMSGFRSSEHPFVIGFSAGTKQAELERTQSRMDDLSALRDKHPDKDLERDME